MFDDYSPLASLHKKSIQLNPSDPNLIEINAQKIKRILDTKRCFRANDRKALWSYILQLPNNKDEYKALSLKPSLPQAKELCEKIHCQKETFPIFNSLVHWHASLIHCMWLPPFVDQLTRGFSKDPVFVFEVIITFLTNQFGEWIRDVPGPPPDVIARIDAIFAFFDPALREEIGTGFIGWPVYRSSFAENLYEHSWFEIMDNILCSSPQFLEFMVVSWLDVNANQLRIDHKVFHATKRPINVIKFVDRAKEMIKNVNKSLLTFNQFKPIPTGTYPFIESSSDAVVLRTLQSDYEKLEQLQQKLSNEREIADDAEKVKERRRQAINSINELHYSKENEEKHETAKASVAIDSQMQRLRLEARKMRLNDELHYLDQWINDWNSGVDFSTKSLKSNFGINKEVAKNDDIKRFQAYSSMRQNDNLLQESRKMVISRARQARSELDSLAHQKSLEDEIRNLADNPDLNKLGPDVTKSNTLNSMT